MNLIGNDLVIVYPMKSRTGYLQYLQFTVGSKKGGMTPPEDTEGPDETFDDGDADGVLNDPFHLRKPDENQINYTSSAVVEPVAAGASTVLAWGPVVKGVFTDDTGAKKDVKIVRAAGTVEYANVGSDGKTVTPGTAFVLGDKVAYQYDNVQIPQNDLPIVNARMRGVSLHAKARRVAISKSVA